MTDDPAQVLDLPEGVVLNDTLLTIGTTRAVRHLRPDPVPEHLVQALVWAGTRAASPNNTQLWRFVVVTDPEQKKAIRSCLDEFVAWIDSLGKAADESDARIRAEARHLVVHVDHAPVLLFVCAEHTYPQRHPDPRYLWSAVNTASQNVLVAARSLGLGATLTMMQVGNEQGVRDVLGLPEHVWIGTLIPIGFPDRPFGPVRRDPLAEVIYQDHWRGRADALVEEDRA